jgi:hypothetical protein
MTKQKITVRMSMKMAEDIRKKAQGNPSQWVDGVLRGLWLSWRNRPKPGITKNYRGSPKRRPPVIVPRLSLDSRKECRTMTFYISEGSIVWIDEMARAEGMRHGRSKIIRGAIALALYGS